MVSIDKSSLVIGALTGLQAGRDEVGQVSGGQPDRQGLPVHNGHPGAIGVEQQIVNPVVAVQQAEPVRRAQQPVGDQVGGLNHCVPVSRAHPRAELVDGDLCREFGDIAQSAGTGFIRLRHHGAGEVQPGRVAPPGPVQSGQRRRAQSRLGHAAPKNLIALDRRCHIGQQQNELRAVVGDGAVIAAGEWHRDRVRHLGVEGVFGAVTQGDPIAHRLVLGGQLNDERVRERSLRTFVANRGPEGGAGLAGSDRGDLGCGHGDRIAGTAQHRRQPLGSDLLGRSRNLRCRGHGGDYTTG